MDRRHQPTQAQPAVAYLEALSEAIAHDDAIDSAADPQLARLESQSTEQLVRLLNVELRPALASRRARRKEPTYDAAGPTSIIPEGAEVRTGYAYALNGTLVCRLGRGNTLTLPRIHVPHPGDYEVEFHYANGNDRREAYVAVNEAPEQIIAFPRTGNWQVRGAAVDRQ